MIGYRGFFYHFLRYDDGDTDGQLGYRNFRRSIRGCCWRAFWIRGSSSTVLIRPRRGSASSCRFDLRQDRMGLDVQRRRISDSRLAACVGISSVPLDRLQRGDDPVSPGDGSAGTCDSREVHGPRGQAGTAGSQTSTGIRSSVSPLSSVTSTTHCWVDFRGIADSVHEWQEGVTYAENTRRATLAQQAYCIANPGGFTGYGALVWGLTACDGPTATGYLGYSARGAPGPGTTDDGTIAPTAAGGSMPFTPEISLPTLRNMYDQYRTTLWTPYGFADAFNLKANWWDRDVIGIDQGPIALMIDNYRTGGHLWARSKGCARDPARGCRQPGSRR